MALDLSALDDGIEQDGVKQQLETAPRAPLNSFVEDPDQPRTEFDDPAFDDFVDDIKVRGILQPIIVRRKPDGKLLIRFGARRYRAACRLGLPDAPYTITEDERQFDDYAQVSENERRQPLQPFELAHFVARRLAKGDKKNVIAANLKIDPSAITHLLALSDNPPAFIVELYHTRKCRTTQYLYELRKLHEKNSELVERMCAESDEIDRRLITAIADAINPKVQPPSPVETTVKGVLDNIKTNDSDHPKSNGSDSGDTKTQQLPFHNPLLEKDPSKPDDETKIKKPLLLATYEGRAVIVLITQRPTSPGLAFIRYEDGSGGEEVAIGELTLTMLTDSKA